MSLTTYDSLKVNSLTPDHLPVLDENRILVDGRITADAYGVEVQGDFLAAELRVAEDATFSADIKAGNLIARGDVTVSTFAGEGNRVLVADAAGKVAPGRPEVAQAYARFTPSNWGANGGTPILLGGNSTGAENGSLLLPTDWWKTGKRLSLFMLIEWEKQAGAGLDLDFWVDLVDSGNLGPRLVDRSLSSYASEGTVPTSGAGVLELELQTGLIAGCGGYQIDVIASYRFNNADMGRSQHTVEIDDLTLRPFVQFSGTTGTNSVTVHAASLVAYEAPPWDLSN